MNRPVCYNQGETNFLGKVFREGERRGIRELSNIGTVTNNGPTHDPIRVCFFLFVHSRVGNDAKKKGGGGGEEKGAQDTNYSDRFNKKVPTDKYIK